MLERSCVAVAFGLVLLSTSAGATPISPLPVIPVDISAAIPPGPGVPSGALAVFQIGISSDQTQAFSLSFTNGDFTKPVLNIASGTVFDLYFSSGKAFQTLATPASVPAPLPSGQFVVDVTAEWGTVYPFTFNVAPTADLFIYSFNEQWNGHDYFYDLLFGYGADPDVTLGFSVPDVTWQSTSVPEPSTLALLGAGLLGFGAMRRRKPKAAV